MSKKIVKRDGQIVNFDINKIDRAISLALGETSESIDWGKFGRMLEQIDSKIDDGSSIVRVQDVIIDSLMEFELYSTAKAYIQYMHKRDSERLVPKKKGLLSDEFISKYKHSPSPMTQLGELVFYRTYSRYLPEFNRREYWWETVRRAVEYNCSLIKTSVKEAEDLYDAVFNLKVFLSGRTFWVGGTDVALKYPMSNYNCSFQVIDDYDAFRDVFYLLMIGSGAGVRVLKSDAEKLPRIRTDLNVIHSYVNPVKKEHRVDHTSLNFISKDMVEIIVGDSKDGWVQALDYFFKLQYSKEYSMIKNLVIDYSNVRPKGETLKTFGGTASGHQSLMNMFLKINDVIRKYNFEQHHKLSPIDVVDICNIIGENVVVGGVRRTSEVVLFDSDDEEVMSAKSNLYSNNNGKWEINEQLIHRQMSNNSVFYNSKPSRVEWHDHIEKMRYSGEPKFIGLY
jgi:adenosylcobalamin-dependent ribonucleoside-triphosphate reductase